MGSLRRVPPSPHHDLPLTQHNAIRYLPQVSTKYVMRKYIRKINNKQTKSMHSHTQVQLRQSYPNGVSGGPRGYFIFVQLARSNCVSTDLRKKKKRLRLCVPQYVGRRKIDLLDAPRLCCVCELWSECPPHLIHCAVDVNVY